MLARVLSEEKYKNGILEIIPGCLEYLNTPLFSEEHQEYIPAPGFAHTLFFIAGALIYAKQNSYYPILNDEHWYYGKWCDYFEPFWDECEKQEILTRSLPKKVININFEKGDGHRWGLDIRTDPSVRPYLADQIIKLYKLNPHVENLVSKITTQFPICDLAIHCRLNYEISKGAISWDRYQENIEHFLKEYNLSQNSIFVLADDFKAIRLCEKFFNQNVLTLCPPSFNGSASNIRKSEYFLILLAEIEIARRSRCFIGSEISGVFCLILLLRLGEDKQTLIIG